MRAPSARNTTGSTPESPVSMKLTRGALRLASLVALVVIGISCGEGADRASGTGPSGGSAHPLIFVGIDGATWDVIDPMVARGELPNFGALMSTGARGVLLSVPPMVSPVVWTTMATGTFARSHWILDFTHPYTGGPQRPVGSRLRRDPALWNIASAAGRRVGVIAYYATHPPEKVNGFMVSDRMLEARGAVYPRELEARVTAAIGDARRGAGNRALLARFLPWDYRPEAADDPIDPHHRATKVVRGRVNNAILRDESVRRVGITLLEEEVDLFMVYFRLVDHASHATWMWHDDTDYEPKPDPFDTELLGNLVTDAYRFMDEFLGAVLEATGGGANIVVTSDHGFGSATGIYQVDEERREVLTGNHRPDGIFLAAGPDIREGELDDLTTPDVVPTLLALLDLPVSATLPGRVAPGLLRADYATAHPRREAPAQRIRWEPAEAGEDGADPADEEALAALEALGYLGGASRRSEGDSDGEEGDFWSITEMLRERELLGELVYHLLVGDAASARALLDSVEVEDAVLAATLPGRAFHTIDGMEEAVGRPLRGLRAIRDEKTLRGGQSR